MKRPALVVAAGGYRSGSTLQYNLIGEYVERLNAGRRIGFLQPPAVRCLERHWSIVEAIGLSVAKAHDAGVNRPAMRRRLRGHKRGIALWHELLDSQRLVALYTVRDWRDVAASMCRKFQLDAENLFESRQWRENLANLNAWMEMNPLVQRYEDLVGDAFGSLRDLAERVGLEFVREIADQAVQSAGIDAQITIAKQVEAGSFDRRTLVHWDHIASPEGGTWRAWPEKEQSLLSESVRDLMDRFGYRS